MLTNIWYFIRAVSKQWTALVTGSAVAALVTLYEHRVGGTVPWSTYGWIIAAYVLWASCSVYLAQSRELDELRSKIAALEDSSRAALILKFPFGKLGVGNFNDWIRLENMGPGTALDIQIEQIERGPYRVVFEKIQTLKVGPDVPVQVTVYRDGEYHPIFSSAKMCIAWFSELFGHDAKFLADPDRLQVPVTIHYTDIHQKRRTATLLMRVERPSMNVDVYCPTS